MKNNYQKISKSNKNQFQEVFVKKLDKYINHLTAVVGGLAIAYGLVHIFGGKRLLGAVDLTVGGTLLCMLVFGRKLSQKTRGVFLAVFLLIFLMFLVYDGATGNVGYLWMIIYPSVIFYILGIGLGGAWVGLGSFSLLSISILHFMNVLDLPYGDMTIIQLNVVYGAMGLLSFLAEKDRHERSLVLKKTSQRLTFVIRNSPLIVFILDSRGDFIFSDGAGLKSLGLSPGEVVGRSAFEMYENSPAVVSGIKNALSGNKADDLVVLGEYYFQTQFSPIIDNENKITGVMGLAVDVTKEQANKLGAESKLKELERLNKLMVGRELKMADLKKKLNEYENKN